MLSQKAQAGLLDYLDGPVATQLAAEVGDPADITFVFGHTHKPFSDVRHPPGYARPVSIFNTGGWVVDTPEPEPVKGTSIVLIDDDLNVAVLQCYAQDVGDNDPEDNYAVRVEGPATAAENPLVTDLRAAYRPGRDPWRALAEATGATVRDRRRRWMPACRQKWPSSTSGDRKRSARPAAPDGTDRRVDRWAAPGRCSIALLRTTKQKEKCDGPLVPVPRRPGRALRRDRRWLGLWRQHRRLPVEPGRTEGGGLRARARAPSG